MFIRYTDIFQDGRILFTDPVIIGQKYMEFKASKDAVSFILITVENNNSTPDAHFCIYLYQ